MSMTKTALENWLKYEVRKMNENMTFSLIDFEPHEGGVQKGFVVVRFVSKMFASMNQSIRHKVMEDIINNQMKFVSRLYVFMHEEATPEEIIN